MAGFRGIVTGVAGVALVIVLAACRPALANESSTARTNQQLSTVSATPAFQNSGEVVWARIPYCNCLAGAATDNVAAALKEANLTVSLKEVSPRDGWLYFVATYDPLSATPDQVGTAIVAGGGQVLEGPP
jgi:hypothetical protein